MVSLDNPLYEQEQLLHLFIDGVSDYAVLMLDPEGNVMTWNSGAQRIKGYAAGEILGRHFSCFYTAEDVAAGKPKLELATALATGRFEEVGPRVRKDGSTFQANVIITALQDHGKLVGYGKITRDLTEKIKADDNLAASEARFQSLVDTVLNTVVDGLIIIDSRGRIQFFNPACQKLFQYTAGEVVGQNVKMLMPEPFHSEHDRYLDNYTRTGERQIIGIGRRVVGRRKDGTTFPMDLSVGEAKQAEGSIFVGIIHDLTERERSERELKEAVARLRAVVETAVDGVILIDARGTVLMFNPACEKLFGYAADEVTGHNVKVLMPEPFHSEHDGYLANYHRTGDRKIIGIGREVSGRRKDGTTFPMDLSVGEARQENESIFVGIIHDLTYRKRTEEQLIQAQKMETVGQLSGGIAHDFNNLLTVILGNAEILIDRFKARPDLKEFANSIVSAGERGAELTQRLLAFSRRQTLQPIVIDCNQLVDGMRQLLRRTLREDIEVRVSLDPTMGPAFADPAQLESAILNLALNAQDAMAGGGSLLLSTAGATLDQSYTADHPEVRPGSYVMISVTDDGHGMPQEVIARAFEPFFTTKDVGKGSGLGLSMVYGFVKQSNGHVAIYSEIGLGTTVRLYLPASNSQAAAQDEDTSLSNPNAANDTPRGRETVLVVEDDPFVRGYAVATLEALGYRVMTAHDGREALVRLTQTDAPNVLFSDVVMPGGISGLELAERALAVRPGIKVLLTSGYSQETLVARNQAASLFPILSKPYRKADLARRLRDILDSE